MTDIATRERTTAPALVPGDPAQQPLTGKQLEARLAAIQDVMRNVMREGVDYGVIPGTDKPTLLKPGAEKLVVTFKLSAADPTIVDVLDERDDTVIRYRVRVPILSAAGVVLAVGVGECSSNEEKYKWRKPVHPSEFENAPIDRKRQKYTRKGDVWDQVRVEPADVANTILKMAHKRAYIHAAIMATAAGSIFTQDVEDLPDGAAADDGEATRRQPPQSRTAAATTDAGGSGAAISDPQDKRLFAICKDKNVDMQTLKDYLEVRYPYTVVDGKVSTARIRRSDYDVIVDAVKGGNLA